MVVIGRESDLLSVSHQHKQQNQNHPPRPHVHVLYYFQFYIPPTLGCIAPSFQTLHNQINRLFLSQRLNQVL